MIENSTNYITPSLRFSGFKDSWKKMKLGDIASVLQGYGFPDKYQGQKEGELPFCKVGDISSAVDRGDLEITTANNYVNHALLPSLHAQPIPVGSTVFAKIGEAIRSNKKIRTGVPCLIDNNAAAVKSKGEISDAFLFYLVSRINLADYSGGIVPSVNKSTIEAIEVMVPNSQEEQLKIASCLLAIDKLISAQNHTVESLKAHKKGLMQQLFPHPGETMPRLRFPGFEGEWNVKTLGELATKVNRRNRQFQVSRVLTNSATEGIIDQNNYFDRDIAVKDNTENYHIVDTGDFVYNPRISVSAPVGPISVNKIGTGIMSPLYTVFRFNDGYVPFYEQYFQTDIWHQYLKSIANFGARFDRMNITTDGFFNMPIVIPLLSEMKKIAECLSSLDQLISAEEKELESLKIHKKGLMQQLFPQPIE